MLSAKKVSNDNLASDNCSHYFKCVRSGSWVIVTEVQENVCNQGIPPGKQVESRPLSAAGAGHGPLGSLPCRKGHHMA